MTSSIPTKRLTFDTDFIKVPDPKGHMKRSIFQRVEQNYRGKSTIPHKISIEIYCKFLCIFIMLSLY